MIDQVLSDSKKFILHLNLRDPVLPKGFKHKIMTKPRLNPVSRSVPPSLKKNIRQCTYLNLASKRVKYQYPKSSSKLGESHVSWLALQVLMPIHEIGFLEPLYQVENHSKIAAFVNSILCSTPFWQRATWHWLPLVWLELFCICNALPAPARGGHAWLTLPRLDCGSAVLRVFYGARCN